MLVSDPGVVSHQGHIASHHQLQATGQGKTVHYRDGREGQALDPTEQVDDLGQVWWQQRRIGERGLEIGEVGAGAESPSFAPYDECLDGHISAYFGHRRGQFGYQLRIQGI